MTGPDHAAEISSVFLPDALLRLAALVMRPGDARAPAHVCSPRSRTICSGLQAHRFYPRVTWSVPCGAGAAGSRNGLTRLQSGIWLSAQLLLLFRALVPDKSFAILRQIPRRSHAQS
jgi:hypothetical protein